MIGRKILQFWPFSGINVGMFRDSRPDIKVRCCIDGLPSEVVRAADGLRENSVKRWFSVSVLAKPAQGGVHRDFLKLPPVMDSGATAPLRKADRLLKEGRITQRIRDELIAIIRQCAGRTMDNLEWEERINDD